MSKKLIDSKTDFIKTPLNIQQQIEELKSRGIIINNDDEAKNILKCISYFRLKAYWYHLKQNDSKIVHNVGLNDIFDLCMLDHQLRILVFDAIGIIEISMRSFITNYIALKYGEFGHYDAHNFYHKKTKKGTYYYREWFDELEKSIKKNDKSPYIKHFKDKYNQADKIPIWASLEIASFSNLSKMFRNMKAQDGSVISKNFQLSKGQLYTILHHISLIRNICAHHTRLWNMKLHNNNLEGFGANIDQSRLFFNLLLIKHMLDYIDNSYSNRWKQDIDNLLQQFLNNKACLDSQTSMGLIDNWHNNPKWR